MPQAIFAAGCFWGVEATLRRIEGVLDSKVGYIGGTTDSPTYQEVCTKQTGHAEACAVDFDENLLSYRKLLAAFWKLHDPTQKNRQGLDVGRQYRSAIFCCNDQQMDEALASRSAAQQGFANPIVTEILLSPKFWRAEEYHQRYLEKRKSGSCFS